MKVDVSELSTRELIRLVRRRRRKLESKPRTPDGFADIRSVLAGAMKALRPSPRLLFTAEMVGRSRYDRRLQGLTFEEIAEHDGVSVRAVETSLYQYQRRSGRPPAVPRKDGEVLVNGSTLARLLGLSVDQVARLKAKGVLKGKRDGSTIRYSPTEAALCVEREQARLEEKANARAHATELKCSDCKRVLPRDYFLTVTVRDKRCKPGYARTGPSYDCRDCRQSRKRASDARRRMVIDGAVERVSHAVVARRDCWRCAICAGEVTRKNWSLDHVVPLSKGGEHTYANVVLAHVRCNSRRGAGRFAVQAPQQALPVGDAGGGGAYVGSPGGPPRTRWEPRDNPVPQAPGMFRR